MNDDQRRSYERRAQSFRNVLFVAMPVAVGIYFVAFLLFAFAVPDKTLELQLLSGFDAFFRCESHVV